MHSGPRDAPFLPLLVTGIAGVAGYNAFRFFRERYGDQVVGTRRRDNWRLTGPGIVACDADDRDELKRLFNLYGFRSVLNAEGSCKLKSCELDPAMAHRVNVLSVRNLVELLAGTDVRLIHLSIDLVFSGTRCGGHVETDKTDPVTVYGATMVQGEQCVRHHKPDACILRISLPMGISFNGHAGAIDWIQSRFRQGKPATLYFDEVRSPTYTDCLNRLFATLLTGETAPGRHDSSARTAAALEGLFHAGGPRKLSLFQIAQIVNRIGGYDPQLLMGCPRAAAGPIPPRAGDVTLCSDKLIGALGYDPFDPWPLWDEHAPDHLEWHFERPRDEEGSAEHLSRVLYRNPSAADWNWQPC